MMRQSLQELYGLKGTLLEQYITFWRRMLVADFGPSLSAFPTPVSVADRAGAAVDARACFSSATLISWAARQPARRPRRLLPQQPRAEVLRRHLMGLHPVPYYIVAFVLLILFGYIWPVFPISGAYPMNMQPDLSLRFIGTSSTTRSFRRCRSILVGIGGWFLGMRSLVSNVVTEDYVIYAELGGVDRNRILSSYVMRNALMPQVTGLAMALGSIFNGAIITEKVFGYPGVGNLLIDAREDGDYSLVLGVTSITIIAVSAAVFLIDMLYPLLDPRVQAA